MPTMSEVPQSVAPGSATADNQITPANITPFSSFKNLGANATLNVKASAGRVFSTKCHNTNGLDRYLQLHNTATVPAPGAVPQFVVLVPSLADVIIGTDFFGPGGMSFATGIAFAFSTTEATYTAGVAGDQVTFVEYV